MPSLLKIIVQNPLVDKAQFYDWLISKSGDSHYERSEICACTKLAGGWLVGWLVGWNPPETLLW